MTCVERNMPCHQVVPQNSCCKYCLKLFAELIVARDLLRPFLGHGLLLPAAVETIRLQFSQERHPETVAIQRVGMQSNQWIVLLNAGLAQTLGDLFLLWFPDWSAVGHVGVGCLVDLARGAP